MKTSKFTKLFFQFLPIILAIIVIFISLPIVKPFFIAIVIAYFLEHCAFFLVKKFAISQKIAKIVLAVSDNSDACVRGVGETTNASSPMSATTITLLPCFWRHPTHNFLRLLAQISPQLRISEFFPFRHCCGSDLFWRPWLYPRPTPSGLKRMVASRHRALDTSFIPHHNSRFN